MSRSPGTRPTRGRRRVVRALAVLLASASVAASAWAVLHEPTVPPERRLVAELTRALLALQGADGAFDPYADDRDRPEVLRTVPHALATAALARAEALGAGREVAGLAPALDRALDVLAARQRPGGGFGALAPDRRNPWPGVEATAGAVLAFGLADRPSDRHVLLAALAALERAVAYELRDGWTRSLVALSLDAACERGGVALLGRDPRPLLRPRGGDGEADAGDEAVAEAIVRTVLGAPGPLPEAVLRAAAEDLPVWTGERSDVPGWWTRAWLAARTPGGAAWAPALHSALEEALASPPEGAVGGGWYADEVTQGAAAILAVGEGLRPR